MQAPPPTCGVPAFDKWDAILVSGGPRRIGVVSGPFAEAVFDMKVTGRSARGIVANVERFV